MKEIKRFLCVAILLLCTCFGLIACDNEGSTNQNVEVAPLNEVLINSHTYEDTATLAENVTPAIVGITSADSQGESVGSGVCFSSGGYILTNAHVVSNPNYIRVHLSNGNSGSASLVWSDESQDIAVLKSSLTLPYLSLGEIDDLRVGEDVVAVGTPLTLSLKHTFTKGIISALNRTLKVTNLSGESYMQNLIQHDASLNPGNSGGPLINNRGEIIGINTLKINGGEGIGFAIPIKSIASALSNIVTDGSYETPFLGVFGYDNEIAAYYGNSEKSKGVYVIDISNKAPLSNCNMQRGDIITSFNGEKVDNMLDLRNALFKCKCGDKVKMQYIQDGILKEVKFVLTTRNI